MSAHYMKRNNHYNNNNHHYHQTSKNSRNSQKSNFVEDLEAAFFLGKLNKHHDREQVYNQLKRLTKPLNFYIRKFDMPNGTKDKRGNKGFAFVHCNTKEQAQRIISMKYIRLGNQECEVKPYGGRTLESGRGTPDSGCVRVGGNKFENPLKLQENLSVSSESFEQIRSRMNSGIQVSESDRSSFDIPTRNVSESESSEEMQKIPLESGQKEEYKVENNYEQQASPVNSHNDDSELRDYWLEKQTEYVLSNVGQNDFPLFKYLCDNIIELLMNSNSQAIHEAQQIAQIAN